MEKEIGVVASGATRGGMTFYATERIHADYVCVREESGNALIFEVLREMVQNSRLTEPDAVRFMEPEDNYLNYNVYIADAMPIACLDKSGRSYRDPYAVVAPGSRVYLATPEDLSHVYDIGPGKNREKIGTLLWQKDVDICLDLDRFLYNQVHLAVVGRTGSGKSWFVRHILELFKMRCMIFSPTDEYDFLRVPHKVRRKNDIMLQLSTDTAKQILDLKPSERKYLSEFIKNGMENRPYTPDELVEKAMEYFRRAYAPKQGDFQISLLPETDESTATSLPQYAASLCRKIGDNEFKMQKLDANTVEENPRCAVYNLQGCRRVEEEKIIYSALYPIFEKRKEQFRSSEREYPLNEHIVIVLEEAQNYAPSTRSTLCKDLLVEIARTGRKYGMHILLLSQRPRYIDQTILSQCGGGVFFNLPNPEDVEYVMTSASLNRSAPFKNMIQNFNTGECILLRAEKSSLDLLCRVSSFDEDENSYGGN